MAAEPTTSFGMASLLLALVPVVLAIILNVVFGVIAMNMAKTRGFHPVPAFFAGLFGSFVALLIIAMFPVRSDRNQ